MSTKALADALATAAREHADRAAVRSGERTMTYAELDDTVTALVPRLRAAGVKAGQSLGVLLPKSIDAVLVIHAGLRLGAFVTPLDPADPPERLGRTLAAGALAHVVCSPDTLRHGTWSRTEHEYTEAPSPVDVPGLALLSRPASRRTHSSSDTGGYILFTSGSTGRPKGVLLSQEAVSSFSTWAAMHVGLGSNDRVASQASLTFDLSTFDLFSSAAVGACVDLVPDYLRLFPIDLVDWLDEREVSVLYTVPSLYRALMEEGSIAARWPRALTTLLFAGEPFPPSTLELYLRQAPRPVTFDNFYGPTETNVCTFERVSRTWSGAEELSIGVAMPDDQVTLVDSEERAGADEGEIVVAGRTVLIGYLEDGVLRDPTRQITFPDGTVRRAYPTGDRAHLGKDGRLYLRGRIDDQVKRNGHRIDLNDVRAAILEVDGVSAAAVVVKTAIGVVGQIWAYACGSGVTADSVAAGSARLLPRRMMPDRVVILPRLPLNDRGKVDRTALACELSS